MTLQPKRKLPLTIVQTERCEIVCRHCGSDTFVKRRKDKKGCQIYLCKNCDRHFTHNPDKTQYFVNPEAEYKKDVWDCRNLGISPGVGKYSYRLTFSDISQSWLMEACKLYIKFTLSTLSFSSGSEKLLATKRLSRLPEPVMRMVLVLQECGMRISELLHLKPDCLLQDKAGDWFLRYYQFKMKKEITIPISREVVRVIQEQQRYIKENLNVKFEYLFSSNEGGGCKGDFTPAPQSMSREAFSRYLNKLALQHNICNALGDRWHFLPHQFRHTVGTRMINNGVPQHIIQRYLGHESPNMTAVYAHIHDQTMKEEIAKYQGKIVNISGLVVEPYNLEADVADLQWFKRNIQAQALPNGSCALPSISQGCPHANACLTCTHFRTAAEYLTEHKQQLEQTNQIIQKAKANGWMRQVEMNEKVKTNLEKIISTLEVDSNDG